MQTFSFRQVRRRFTCRVVESLVIVLLVALSTTPMRAQFKNSSPERQELQDPPERQKQSANWNAAVSRARTAVSTPYVVLGYAELGMHCMNQDFSEICILPPFNTLRAQVIRRGEEPSLVTTGVNVRYAFPGVQQYSLPSNTVSSSKTNFWTYAPALFKKPLPHDIGLAGTGLSGSMNPSGNNDWRVLGIPLTPIDDMGNFNPYQLAKIDVLVGKTVRASTHAVVPVSWDINCNLCHNTPGISVAQDILELHDELHNTDLVHSKPVLCAGCHADPALGTIGVAGVKSFSQAMHGAHANRMAPVAHLGNTCYACHPTNCQRDVHFQHNITCVDCHGDMKAVANPGRIPWVSEPTCGSCHSKINPKFQYEEPGKLFKESRGHGGVHCAACHGPQHAIGPAVTDADNVQSLEKQGSIGTIRKCTVCHTQVPEEPFFHSLDD
jgi:hypothetical protein